MEDRVKKFEWRYISEVDMNQITRKVVRLKILGSNSVFPRRTLRVVYLGDLNEA
jgi:hypothetical protein